MEHQSREDSPPHALSQSASNAEESPSHHHNTPTTAVLNLDGSIQRVRAHRIVCLRLTSGLLNFALHATVLLAAFAVGCVLLFLNMNNSAAVPFQLGVGLVTFAIGGFLPAPQHKDEDTTQLEGNADTAASRAAQMSSASQYVANMV